MTTKIDNRKEAHWSMLMLWVALVFWSGSTPMFLITETVSILSVKLLASSAVLAILGNGMMLNARLKEAQTTREEILDELRSKK